MCRFAAPFIFFAALLTLIVGQAQAQVAPDASGATATGGTSAAQSSSSANSGPSGLAGTSYPQGSFLGSVPGKLEPGVVEH
jgi:hypothetical protein